MVLRGALSAFSRKSRLPLSSTMQMVTSTCWRCASASAAATMVLMAARFRYFLLGRSAADAVRSRHRVATVSLNMDVLNMVSDASTGSYGFPESSTPEAETARLGSLADRFVRQGLLTCFPKDLRRDRIFAVD